MWYSITTSFGNPSFTKQSKVNPLSKLSSAVLMQRLEIRISARDKKGRNHLQAKTGIVSDLPEVKPCLLTASQLLPSRIKQNPSPKLLPESCNYLENQIVSVAPRPITGKGASIYTAGPCRSLRCPLSPRPQRFLQELKERVPAGTFRRTKLNTTSIYVRKKQHMREAVRDFTVQSNMQKAFTP
ncbi:hypothetical protein Anapl_14631 [Anas platyrhynchos]|uniref:Uncharacterized protein n=1 Tax=Anas platyrhynchos TaxID=8839 RepID=R0LBN6_ANAPL|nr:hypothetical protein Anapl_14631 [Anas platyrhynchos]